MLLTRLIYASTKKDTVSIDDIQAILQTARANNKKQNITGLLCLSNRYFLQVLEGEREVVSQLFHKIAQDKRHDTIILFQFTEIDSRQFENWSMGYVPESSLTADTLLRYSVSKHLDPTVMSGENLHQLMLALKAVVPLV